MGIEKAARELGLGRFVVLFDGSGREAEADLVLHASFATPGKIALMRRDGGGLLCLATDGKVAKSLGLPFMGDVLARSRFPTLKAIALRRAPYGDAPSFSITVNHAKAFTGVTDNDRALAAREFARLAAGGNGVKESFRKRFVSPGHLHLLIGRGLEKRRGHTELALGLARRGGMVPAVLLCEMLGKGKALSRRKAAEYAKRHGLAFVEGRELL